MRAVRVDRLLVVFGYQAVVFVELILLLIYRVLLDVLWLNCQFFLNFSHGRFLERGAVTLYDFLQHLLMLLLIFFVCLIECFVLAFQYYYFLFVLRVVVNNLSRLWALYFILIIQLVLYRILLIVVHFWCRVLRVRRFALVWLASRLDRYYLLRLILFRQSCFVWVRSLSVQKCIAWTRKCVNLRRNLDVLLRWEWHGPPWWPDIAVDLHSEILGARRVQFRLFGCRY